jgi:hypothetical protein
MRGCPSFSSRYAASQGSCKLTRRGDGGIGGCHLAVPGLATESSHSKEGGRNGGWGCHLTLRCAVSSTSSACQCHASEMLSAAPTSILHVPQPRNYS